MEDGERGRPGRRPRPPKPTPAERRETRGRVEDLTEVVDAAARFLEARPRSISEVRRKLQHLGYQATLVEAAVARLVELRYLDDDAFARTWVESRDRAKPRGEHALRRELGLKGVERSLLDSVLAERRDDALADAASSPDGDPGPSADDVAAERLLQRKMSTLLREPDLRRRQQRAYALLARNGFDPGICGSVSRRLLTGASASDDDLPEPEDD